MAQKQIIEQPKWIQRYNNLEPLMNDEQKEILSFIRECRERSNGNNIGKPTGKIDDTKFEEAVARKFESLKSKERSINFLNIDEDQIKEVDHVQVQGYRYYNADLDCVVGFRGFDDIVRSPLLHVAYLYFGEKQLFIYKCYFDLLSDAKKEVTYEYFYRDITSFTKICELDENNKVEAATGCLSGCFGKPVNRKFVSVEKGFRIVVPNDAFEMTVNHQPGLDASINAMQQKIRERKYQ